MVSSDNISNKLEHIETYLQRIESKIDNFVGFEQISKKEEEELNKIKSEMKDGKYHSYDDVFN